MKYYIILQPSIFTMGGEEMYTRNKVIAAKQQGFVPLVFHSAFYGEKLYVRDLERFKELGFPEFRYAPCVVSSSKKRKLISKIKDILHDCDKDSIIESHEILVALWGEWMAKELGIRHLAYMLLEHNDITNKSVYSFFKFKYNRHELVGICDNTIPDMLSTFQDKKTVKEYRLPAYCTNTYDDVPCPSEFKVDGRRITIGSIGRTNKRYVLSMVDAIGKFVTKHSDLKFNILYVGGSGNKKSEQQVIAKLSQLTNATLYFTGMIFPIPISMVRQMDVCVASSGSCVVSYNCGIPTISLDANDSDAIGIYKETTHNIIFRDNNEPQIKVEELLEEVLIHKKFGKRTAISPEIVDFSSHWDFIRNMNAKREYYDINSIKLSFKEKCKAWMLGYYYGLNHGQMQYRFLHTMLNVLTR